MSTDDRVPAHILEEAKRAYTCPQCDHRQRSAMKPWERCGSRKAYSVKFLEQRNTQQLGSPSLLPLSASSDAVQ